MRINPISCRAALKAIFSIVLAAVTSLAIQSGRAFASDTIEFPEDELAPESVLPVFDNPATVLNRAVTMKNRLEVGPQLGLSLMEPFYNPLNYGATLTYFWNEESGINIFGTFFAQGLNSNGSHLNPVPGLDGLNANLQYAPAPEYFVLANYQFNAFYGKISLTKDYTMNLGLFGFAGLGAFGIGNSMNPAGDFGLGQNFFFTRNMALRLDLRFMVYQGPDVTSVILTKATSVQPASAFNQEIQYSAYMSAAFVFYIQ